MTTTITSEDFMTGIIAGLALRHVQVVDAGDTRFDQALAAAYEVLLDREDETDLDIDFQIIPDEMHGDSSVVRDAITRAISSRLIGRVNPTFKRLRIYVDEPWAEDLTRDLPGGRDLYAELFEAFWHSYKGISSAA